MSGWELGSMMLFFLLLHMKLPDFVRNVPLIGRDLFTFTGRLHVESPDFLEMLL
jgi:hypothetical protein